MVLDKLSSVPKTNRVFCMLGLSWGISCERGVKSSMLLNESIFVTSTKDINHFSLMGKTANLPQT